MHCSRKARRSASRVSFRLAQNGRPAVAAPSSRAVTIPPPRKTPPHDRQFLRILLIEREWLAWHSEARRLSTRARTGPRRLLSKTISPAVHCETAGQPGLIRGHRALGPTEALRGLHGGRLHRQDQIQPVKRLFVLAEPCQRGCKRTPVTYGLPPTGVNNNQLDEYIKRMDYYRTKQFTNFISDQSGLTFFDAYEATRRRDRGSSPNLVFWLSNCLRLPCAFNSDTITVVAAIQRPATTQMAAASGHIYLERMPRDSLKITMAGLLIESSMAPSTTVCRTGIGSSLIVKTSTSDYPDSERGPVPGSTPEVHNGPSVFFSVSIFITITTTNTTTNRYPSPPLAPYYHHH
ncbi:uncharacterized protein K452DRAFT_339526 [Aplosporella prunicola CBS 121167]|uniref:WAC domain-containing protein n=1 Tax=Aplosporella prunicola CBS 121167 TaxID=1176127 RepID=A0A6A6B4G8_9PEZI|nr:uncharacterized protein K452DRAFT_339526 [Aplosporella prunicola CBS 121167]KAF2137867.1 hypothetical protein K452DRAFT_339526 [Aplosporella prunicola CBS 121167]